MGNNDSGHEQNVTNFEVLITRVSTFSSAYNPARKDLSISSLGTLKDSGKESITQVKQATTSLKNATADRLVAFAPFDKLVTRSINALRISGVSAQTVAYGESLVRDLRGKRASDKLSDDEIAAAKEKGESPGQVTVHNASFDSKVQNFDSYTGFLSSIPEYVPNETDLTVSALKSLYVTLKGVNDGVNQAEADLKAARIERASVLYVANTGLVDVALAVKTYVKSAFGATSPQYKTISDIAFTRHV